MNSCAGCEFLKIEDIAGGKKAGRCFDPQKRTWGTGRVVDVPRRVILPNRIERPAWCRKETDDGC